MEATIIAAMHHWGMAVAFLGGLALTVWAEAHAPLFAAPAPDDGRIGVNLTLGVLTLAGQVIAALVLAQLASVSIGYGLGLLPWLGLAGLPLILVSLLLLDLLHYALHRLSHRVGWLWRLHRVHHSDPGLDVTTTFRHHPLDQFVVAAWTAGFAIVLGLSPAALLLYGAIVVLLGPLQHADLALPPRLERVLALVLASPGLHQSHHSARQVETDSNYGNVSSLWDRLFGSFRPLSEADRRALTIGLGPDHDPGGHDLRHQLRSPFVR